MEIIFTESPSSSGNPVFFFEETLISEKVQQKRELMIKKIVRKLEILKLENSPDPSVKSRTQSLIKRGNFEELDSPGFLFSINLSLVKSGYFDELDVFGFLFSPLFSKERGWG